MVKKDWIDALEMDGGYLCLDFINTVQGRKSSAIREVCRDMSDLIYWAANKTGHIGPRRAEAMEARAMADPGEAKAFYEGALLLRELFYRMFLSVSEGQPLEAEDLRRFNEYVTEYFAHVRLQQSDKGCFTGWDWEMGDFHTLTAYLVKSASDLLLSEDKLGRVKACPSCGWLFLDATKNGKRRWCSMKSCGSNAKATQYYHRKKAG